MLEKRVVACCVGFALILAASVAIAGEGRRLARPHRFLPQTDRGLVELTTPAGGTTWAAWSYRNGAERDIALSTLDDRGLWTEPILIGLDDGVDQVQPALAADPAGTLYLAFAERSTGRVLVSTRPIGSETWSDPTAVTRPGERGASPALRVVGDRLVVAFLVESGASIVVLPTAASGTVGHSIQQGPDPVGSKPPEQDEDDAEEAEGGGSSPDTGSVELAGPKNRRRY